MGWLVKRYNPEGTVAVADIPQPYRTDHIRCHPELQGICSCNRVSVISGLEGTTTGSRVCDTIRGRCSSSRITATGALVRSVP